MTNELCINGFSAVSEDEMMVIDGGGWISFACGVLGGVVGIVCTAETANPVTIMGATSVGVLAGITIGDNLENALEN
ncbi:MAG: hypothetical protein BKP49_04325 [Treponema sp. CETP13]|nr:MAG: hypothetical protein BKP49_04325 [Treponema sp. CETP13]